MAISDDRVIELGLAIVAERIKAGDRAGAHSFLDNGVFWALDCIVDEQDEAA